MADKRAGAYGKSGGDTDFRKTWDKEEWAQRARDHEAKEKEESKARYEAKLQGKKYHRRASTPPDARETSARQQRIDVASMIGKSQLVPAGSGVGKKGRSAGFYCPDCDITLRNNHELIEHQNSTQHLRATGQTGQVSRSTVEQVHDRLCWLKRKREDEMRDVVVDLDLRLESRREEEEREREEKRRKRNEKRRKTKDGQGVPEVKMENDGIIC
ncbi:hypothetical protein BDV95DRAFT_192885 [Massariosphaeria phaeospora]|uniref:C2H2-type domain-containing protein n=1 Tax=Massariosphaeria phaeospora TaxID=100035 RepID=A0A7C8I8G9_9PLEO|nr:hypothetical protein BDV95DRAFT_192885 [Massariosphaeria phaeospora]